MPSVVFWGEICITKLKDLTFLSRNFDRGTLGMSNFKILSIRWHQVDTKDSGSQNTSFLAFKATSVASR
jgi:hypothetical protein